MNQAEQELKRIERSIEQAQYVLDNPHKYDLYDARRVKEDIIHLNQRKSDILLGLEAGRKEVFEELEKTELQTGKNKIMVWRIK